MHLPSETRWERVELLGTHKHFEIRSILGYAFNRMPRVNENYRSEGNDSWTRSANAYLMHDRRTKHGQFVPKPGRRGVVSHRWERKPRDRRVTGSDGNASDRSKHTVKSAVSLSLSPFTVSKILRLDLFLPVQSKYLFFFPFFLLLTRRYISVQWNTDKFPSFLPSFLSCFETLASSNATTLEYPSSGNRVTISQGR